MQWLRGQPDRCLRRCAVAQRRRARSVSAGQRRESVCNARRTRPPYGERHPQPLDCFCSLETWKPGKLAGLLKFYSRVTTRRPRTFPRPIFCLLYTSDAADEEDSVDLGGRRIIKKK